MSRTFGQEEFNSQKDEGVWYQDVLVAFRQVGRSYGVE